MSSNYLFLKFECSNLKKAEIHVHVESTDVELFPRRADYRYDKQKISLASKPRREVAR